MLPPKRIGIAIVEHHGKYLVGIRGPDGPLARFAEFPGGKCLIDESPLNCAVRECFEESGLVVVPARLLQRREFAYPHGQVDLHFVLCHPAHIAEVRELHGAFRWEAADELRKLNFPEANAAVIDLLG